MGIGLDGVENALGLPGGIACELVRTGQIEPVAGFVRIQMNRRAVIGDRLIHARARQGQLPAEQVGIFGVCGFPANCGLDFRQVEARGQISRDGSSKSKQQIKADR